MTNPYPPEFKPRYVLFDGQRWYACQSEIRDGDVWCYLRRQVVGRDPEHYWALASETTPYVRPVARTVRGNRAELVTLVVSGRTKRPKRYEVTLGLVAQLLDEAAGRKRRMDRQARTGRRGL